MKILILCIPRSGSSTLAYAIGKTYGIEKYYEPFNKAQTSVWDDNYYDTDHVLKTMIYDTNLETFPFSIYDRIIYLSRRDLLEAAQSFSYAVENSKEDGEWLKPYFLPKSDEPTWHYEWFKKVDLKLKEVADKIVYYEDLYSRDIDLVYKILEEVNMVDKFDTLFAELTAKGRYRSYNKNLI